MIVIPGFTRRTEGNHQKTCRGSRYAANFDSGAFRIQLRRITAWASLLSF